MILTQIIGGVGYIILLIATQVHKKSLFLFVDASGLIPVAIHYLMLDAPVGAAMSLLYMIVDLTTAYEDRVKIFSRIYVGHYVVAIILVVLNFKAITDILALFGTFSALVSRQQSKMRDVLTLIFISCIGWGLYGVFAGSVGQVVFSSVYALFSLMGIWRISHNKEIP